MPVAASSRFFFSQECFGRIKKGEGKSVFGKKTFLDSAFFNEDTFRLPRPFPSAICLRILRMTAIPGTANFAGILKVSSCLVNHSLLFSWDA
jgi:hypothetical protein